MLAEGKNVETTPGNIPPVAEEAPNFRKIFMKNITCRGAQQAVCLHGLPVLNIDDVIMENIDITAENGMTCIDATGINFKNIRLVTEKQPILYFLTKPGPFLFAPARTECARNAYKSVLKYAGDILPLRDNHDSRIISEKSTGICSRGDSCGAGSGITDSKKSAGGRPRLLTCNVTTDSDGDGMPDAWEVMKSLDRWNPDDRNRVAPSGYTILEEYINGHCGK